MKHEIGDIWKVKKGDRTVWKLKLQTGILSFETKTEAVLVKKVFQL